MDKLSTCFLDISNDLFGLTWQVSYVRFVEVLKNSSGTSSSELLASILYRSPAGCLSPEDWLPSSYILEASVRQLKEHLDHALYDIKEGMDNSGNEANMLLFEVLQRLDIENAKNIFAISSQTESVASVGSNQCGPTYQMFWQCNNRFYFLEIHNES